MDNSKEIKLRAANVHIAAVTRMLEDNEAANMLIGAAAKIAAAKCAGQDVDAAARAAFLDVAGQMFDMAVEARDAS